MVTRQHWKESANSRRSDRISGRLLIGRHPSNPSRRDFLTALAGTGGAMLLGPHLQAAEADPRVVRIVSGTIAVDMHSHVQIPFVKDQAKAAPDPDIDLAGEMRRSGFSAICQTYNIDSVVSREAGPYYKYNLQALGFEDRLLAHNHMRRALSLKDLQTAHEQRLPIIVQSAEGAQFIEGRLERVEEVYRRGVRHLQLLHEQDDTVSPLGDVYTAPIHLGGLTSFGAQVIKECNRLGIVVDLAHGTYETVTGALKVATQPLIISHTGMGSEAGNGNTSADMQRRLIAKELAREVADGGGVIGVWWRLADTTKEYVAAIRDAVDTLGVDHIGIGTDTNLTSSNQLPYTNKIWPDENGGFFYAVAGEMLRQGFTPGEIGKIGGGNFCRVFARVTAGHT
jgi:membrane dipeptidase